LIRTPGHSRLLQGTLIGYWSISGTLDELNRYNEALAAIEPAIRIGDRLVELDPANTEGLRSRDIVRGQRAIVLAHLGRYDEAIKLTQQYQHEKELRAAQAPEDAERVRDVAVMLRPLADFYRSKGDKAGACRVLHQGLQVWSDFDRRWKISEMDRRNELEVIQTLLKQCP
jgi:tetratricopeptide (TPR) repeat protein